MMRIERKQVGDNMFNQELKDVKDKENKDSWKSSKQEQQEIEIKLGCGNHKSPNHPEKRDVSNEDKKAQYQATVSNPS